MAILITLAIIVLMGGLLLWFETHKRRAVSTPTEPNLLNRFTDYSLHYGMRDTERKGSRAAYSVAHRFLDIPEDYRPFSGNDLARVLQALDLKWGERAWEHQFSISYFDKEFNDWFWSCKCQKNWNRFDAKHTCKLFEDYGRLAWEFENIKVAADEQERAFKSEGMVEADPEHLKMLLTRAREESRIIRETTSELLGLPQSEDHSAELETIAARVLRRVKEMSA